MSDIPMAMAELGQGALTAGALEPMAGGHGAAQGDADAAGPGHTHESACLNCGTRLIGSHCHACGQHAHVHRTLAAFFHDLAHGVFHVEGKVWRTLPMLAWRPGRLTREYIDGRRASYVSPIALFLFAVFVMFAAMHLVEGSHGGMTPGAALAAQKAELADLQRRRAAARTPAEAAAIDRRISTATETIADLGIIQIQGAPGEANGKDQEWRRELPWLARGVDAFNANPELSIYRLQSSAYKYSWLLIPLSVPLVWLLFPFDRRFHLYDHTVFVTYSLTFMMLLNTAFFLSDAVHARVIGRLLVVVPPVHMYRQLRGTYMTGAWGALWRTAALVVFAVLVMAVFALLLLSLEVAG